MTPFKTLFLSQLKSLSKCISHALMPFWIFCCAELCSNNTLIVFPNVCLTSFASKHDHLLQIIGPPNRNDANIFYVNQNCSNSCSDHLIFFPVFLRLTWNFLYVASTFRWFSKFVLICIFATNLMGLNSHVIRSYPQGPSLKDKLKFREFKIKVSAIVSFVNTD